MARQGSEEVTQTVISVPCSSGWRARRLRRFIRRHLAVEEWSSAAFATAAFTVVFAAAPEGGAVPDEDAVDAPLSSEKLPPAGS